MKRSTRRTSPEVDPEARAAEAIPARARAKAEIEAKRRTRGTMMTIIRKKTMRTQQRRLERTIKPRRKIMNNLKAYKPKN